MNPHGVWVSISQMKVLDQSLTALDYIDMTGFKKEGYWLSWIQGATGVFAVSVISIAYTAPPKCLTYLPHHFELFL